MAIINASSTPMGQIPLEINGVSIVLMYVKESVEGDIITVVTATDVSAGKILPITTIQRLLEEWKLFKKEEDSRTIQFKVIFNHIIKEVENEYSRSGLELSREELQRTREVMENNIEQVVERNERIGLLVDKTDRLTELSNGFRGSAVRVKRSMWWQNVKFWVILVIVVLLILGILMKALA
jgi:vacuolar v-SNARE protein NYV1